MYESNYRNVPLNFGNSDLVINGDAGTCKKAYYKSEILDTNNIESFYNANTIPKQNDLSPRHGKHTHDTIFKYSNYYYWANTSETFIFSFGDGNDWKNFKISRVVDESNAIYESNYRNIPLNFGNSDLVIKDDTGYCNQTYYESQILDSNDFIIEEMEIFRFYQTE
ncbi:16088_t:CDS:2 [Funneliformis mosseae]|uniref:16088_t:CDS:1 n=1 Tax=Funneliformis mosseae TaxID=27381 RepID=A0A9N9GIH1_FUNMO|nr:16088_t:CDS:2 [Funneliformis mosseae]